MTTNLDPRIHALGEFPSAYSLLRHAVQKLSVSPVVNPTPADIVAVAPHITEDAARYLIKEAMTKGRMKFAGPPVCRHDTYHVYCLQHSNDQTRLYRSNAYAAAGVGAYTGSEKFWAPEAIEYAAKYGDDMFQGYAPFLFMVELTDLANIARERVPESLALACSTSLEHLLTCFNEEPLTELLDDAIVKIVSGPAAVDEMSLGATKSWLHFCDQCGGGLNREGCLHCTRRANVYESGRRLWPSAIPRRLASFVMALGHKFALDPNIPRFKEHQKWAHKQLTGVVEISTTDYKAPRMIDVGNYAAG